MADVKIVASGNLNEYKIEKLVAAQAPIDIFGVGTDMVVSRDIPALDLTYKVVQLKSRNDGVRYTAKRSQGKHTIPGRKQVFRRLHPDGKMIGDVIGIFDETPEGSSQPLLKPVIRDGRLLQPLPSLGSVRRNVSERLGRLPKYCRRFTPPFSQHYPVDLSAKILKLNQRLTGGKK